MALERARIDGDWETLSRATAAEPKNTRHDGAAR